MTERRYVRLCSLIKILMWLLSFYCSRMMTERRYVILSWYEKRDASGSPRFTGLVIYDVWQSYGSQKRVKPSRKAGRAPPPLGTFSCYSFDALLILPFPIHASFTCVPSITLSLFPSLFPPSLSLYFFFFLLICAGRAGFLTAKVSRSSFD